MSRRKPQIDPGFEETRLLILSLAPNQRVRCKRRALEWLPVGKKYAGHRAVLENLLERINWKSAVTFPRIARIALDIGYSRRHVMRSMLWLRSEGYVLRKQRLSDWGDQSSSVYTVPVLLGQPIRMSPPPATRDTTRRHPRHHGVVTPTSPITIENSTNKNLTPEANQTLAHERLAGLRAREVTWR